MWFALIIQVCLCLHKLMCLTTEAFLFVFYFQSQKRMEEILSADHEMKMKLADIYHDIIEFMLPKTQTDIDDLREVLSELYENFDDKLKAFKSELVNDECPIVVAGILVLDSS